MSYHVIISRTARKHLDGLPANARSRALREITALQDDPRPHGCLKLTGFTDEYRIRLGAYRIRYRVDDNTPEVAVIDVRHRKDIYRD
jgi:mRNA interferase RelE/StbE